MSTLTKQELINSNPKLGLKLSMKKDEMLALVAKGKTTSKSSKSGYPGEYK